MTMSEIPNHRTYFWPYDIFGYLLPGIIVVAPLTQFNISVRRVIEERYQRESITDNLALLIVCYVVGHLISAVSSIALEHTLLRYTFGYPVSQSLGCPSREAFLSRMRHGILRAENRKPVEGIAVSRIRRWCRRAWIMLFGFLRKIVELLPGFVPPYDGKFTKTLTKHFDEQFGVSHEDWALNRRSHDLFWTTQAYVMEVMPQVNHTSMHFVELYGFSRNACMALLICCTLPWCPEWDFSVCCGMELPESAWLATCFVSAIFMYCNFTKLIRRQNDLVLRAFVAAQARPPRVLNSD